MEKCHIGCGEKTFKITCRVELTKISDDRIATALMLIDEDILNTFTRSVEADDKDEDSNDKTQDPPIWNKEASKL